jgi:predicted metal-binding protein
MNYKRVKPVIDLKVRYLCVQSYPNHPRGCPNYNKKNDCPPTCKTIGEIIDTRKPIYVIWNRFDFSKHCIKMKNRYPSWTQRQIECCLYWQGTARKRLNHHIDYFLTKHPEYVIIRTPEGTGVNVTATMKKIGIILEWPPKTKTYQIALAGIKPAKGSQ